MAVWLLAAVASAQLGQLTAPRKIKDVAPVYPASLQAGDEGWVILELNVTVSGAVGEVVVLGSRCKRLEAAAVAAARQWRYEPIRLNGKPAPFKVMVQVPFKLPPRLKSRAGRSGACEWTEPPKPVR